MPGYGRGSRGISAWQPGTPISFGGTPSNVTSPIGQGPIEGGGGPGFPDPGESQTPLLDQFDTQQANYYRNLQGGFGGFGNTPPAGTPGFLQGPTQHLNFFDAQGYPYAQPATSDNPYRFAGHFKRKSSA